SFGKRVKASENSGFANPGLSLGAALNYQVYKNLGVISQILYQNHQIDNYRYKKDLLLENSSNSYSIQTGGWNNFSLMFGVNAIFYIDDNLTLQPKVMLGANYAQSPKINLSINDSTNHISIIEQSTAKSFAFCFLLGLDVKIDLIHNHYLILGTEFFNADMFFDKVLVKDFTNDSSAYHRFKQPVQTGLIKVGLGFRIK
ncbi:MAG: hypothetical protein AB7O73_15320, partial [Bacteroidia bacterium]